MIKLRSFIALALFCLVMQSPSAQEDDLWTSDSILTLTLAGETRALLSDRGDDPSYYPLELSYGHEKGYSITVELRSKTRGNFRRKKENCRTPPIWLNFDDDKTPENCLFYGQNKLKLVTPCLQDKHVLQEYKVYELYNLLTERSFRTRLVRVIFDDVKRGPSDPMYCFLLEDDDDMARRNNGEIFKHDGLRPKAMSKEDYFRMTVFQYLVGNTDWSIQYRHNIKLVVGPTMRLPIPIPYDFDHAGIVNTPYALPAEELQLSSVRERRYRGYCLADPALLKPTLDEFRAIKEAVYRLYTEDPLLDNGYKKWVVRYLDDFYETIEDPEAALIAFSYPCDHHETSKVVIQGLNH